jgi:hypothetical protein
MKLNRWYWYIFRLSEWNGLFLLHENIQAWT